MTPYTRAEQPEDDGHSADGASSGASMAPAPEGFRLIEVDGPSFDALMSAMDRADRKGFMPYAIQEEWDNFEYRAVEAQPATTKRITPDGVSPAPAPDLAALLDAVRRLCAVLPSDPHALAGYYARDELLDARAAISRIDAVRKEKP